jgi:hypothetical protein
MPRLEIDIAVDDAPATGSRADGDDGGNGHGLHVSGTLVGPDGSISAFVGWVGLLAVLQQAIAEPAPEPPPRSGTS